MTDSGVTPFFGDLVFKLFHHAFLNRFDFMAGAADQVMMMVMPIPRPDFVPRGAINPGHPFHQIFFLENGDEPKNRGKIAICTAHFVVNFRESQGHRSRIQQSDNGQASASGAQSVLPKP